MIPRLIFFLIIAIDSFLRISKSASIEVIDLLPIITSSSPARSSFHPIQLNKDNHCKIIRSLEPGSASTNRAINFVCSKSSNSSLPLSESVIDVTNLESF